MLSMPPILPVYPLLAQQWLWRNCRARPLSRSNALPLSKSSSGRISVNAALIWQTTLERLETAPIDEVSKAWLQSAHLADAPNIGADDIDAASLASQDQAIYFTLQVPSSLSRDVISTR